MKYLIIFLLPVILSAQVNDNLDYFPHKTGDMWEYFYYDGPMYVDTAQVFTIFDSTDSEGNIFVTQTSRYINPIQVPAVPFNSTMRYKIDTLNQIWGPGLGLGSGIYRALLFKLNAQQGDSWIAEADTNSSVYLKATVGIINEADYFGKTYSIMNTFYSIVSPPFDSTGVDLYGNDYAKGLGLVWLGGGESAGSMHLIGAVVDSVLYGDTTDVITSVDNFMDNNLTTTFELEQNYPNPFNPRTNIKFMINVSSNLFLIIYNIEGKEIKRIIDNRFYNPGRYTVYWNGITQSGNKAPSGVYYYSLIINGQLLKTKAMVLLK